MAATDPERSRLQELYSRMETPWPQWNRWSTHTRNEIKRLLDRHADSRQAQRPSRVLNVGSHGNAYGLNFADHFHTDLAEKPLAQINLACVADAQRLPFPDSTFDLVICVGSVINYCDPATVLGELGRILSPGGRLLLEFETSDSFEFLFTDD